MLVHLWTVVQHKLRGSTRSECVSATAVESVSIDTYVMIRAGRGGRVNLDGA